MNNNSLNISLSRKESIRGICWLIISQLILPPVLVTGNALLAAPLSSAKLNFVYYCVNFAAVAWIFRDFLGQSWKAAFKIPFSVIWYGILGCLGCEFFTKVADLLIYRIDPGFLNANNQTALSLLKNDFILMAIGMVLLVPVAEELLYRGVIFRGLWNRSRLWAYLVSILLFAAMHCLGYIGTYSPLQLLLAIVQYLPAGYCLCWTYCQTGTIATPMIMHALVNAMTIYYSAR